jgi:NAD(P)-dependent dehydrogenase (short-subunit alcohol dehydrogenase family)
MQHSHQFKHYAPHVPGAYDTPLRVAITGGTAGLGRALARGFVERNARVAFVARNRERVASTAKEIAGTYGIVGDVSKKESIYPIATQILGTLGGLDILINNASALGPTPLALLPDTECEDFEQALQTNVLGPFRLTKALFGALTQSAREHRGGIVLNISSDAAVNAYPTWGAYGASKAALAHMTRIWDEEFRHEGVRFLSIDPGDMNTELHALAIPDADPSTLKLPEDAARELIARLHYELPETRRTGGAS